MTPIFSSPGWRSVDALARDIIMKARVKAGWVKEEDLVKPDAGTSEEETPAT